MAEAQGATRGTTGKIPATPTHPQKMGKSNCRVLAHDKARRRTHHGARWLHCAAWHSSRPARAAQEQLMAKSCGGGSAGKYFGLEQVVRWGGAATLEAAGPAASTSMPSDFASFGIAAPSFGWSQQKRVQGARGTATETEESLVAAERPCGHRRAKKTHTLPSTCRRNWARTCSAGAHVVTASCRCLRRPGILWRIREDGEHVPSVDDVPSFFF